MIATRAEAESLRFVESVRAAVRGQATETALTVVVRDVLHAKGLLGDAFCLSGSMNFTFRGVDVQTELVTLQIDPAEGTVRIDGRVLHAGERIAIDGSHGRITLEDVPLIEPQVSEQFQTVLAWCDELRTLGVRANADTPEDARRAIELGAEGIGLCRTEHMFLGERQPLMAAVIMAPDG